MRSPLPHEYGPPPHMCNPHISPINIEFVNFIIKFGILLLSSALSCTHIYPASGLNVREATSKDLLIPLLTLCCNFKFVQN